MVDWLIEGRYIHFQNKYSAVDLVWDLYVCATERDAQMLLCDLPACHSCFHRTSLVLTRLDGVTKGCRV